MKLILLATKLLNSLRILYSDHDDSALILKKANATIKQVRDAAEVSIRMGRNRYNSMMFTIYDRQLSANTIILDMMHVIRALDLRHLVYDQSGYVKTMLQYHVVLIAAFDEKVNVHYYGHEVQEALDELDSLVGNQNITNT